MSWLTEEAFKTPAKKDRIILENPEAVKKLDERIFTVFWPFIREKLENSGFAYIPGNEDYEITSTWGGAGDLGRSLIFMLFDDMNCAFFRGTLECSAEGFFLKREFFLSLPEDTDPLYLFRILKDEKLSGMFPSLSIQKSIFSPDQGNQFIITIEAGTGYGFMGWTLDNIAKGDIESVIDTTVKMYEHSMIEGFSSMNDVEDFLKIAYIAYEAS
ncbi:MAG: hypothetical protein PF518_18460 [Spirochaetaceae bacterium]|nr:hypothetical protein [Spirochaetaceae bacterium]